MIEIVCASCGEDDSWVDTQEIIRVTGQEGNVPEVVIMIECACGHKQEE